MNYSEEKGRQRPVPIRYRLIWALIFLIYLAALVYLIFYFTERGEGGVNLELFREIKRFYNAIRENVLTITAYQNLLGNVILFIPFGVIFPLITNRRFTLPKTALAGFTTILAIESTQYLTNTGVFDVDDFFLNGIGIILGWLSYKLLAALYRRHLRGPDFYGSDSTRPDNAYADDSLYGDAPYGDGRDRDWWSAIGKDSRFGGIAPDAGSGDPRGESISVDWRRDADGQMLSRTEAHAPFRKPPESGMGEDYE
jgi:glycopeptide antibiotics resistance protein